MTIEATTHEPLAPNADAASAAAPAPAPETPEPAVGEQALAALDEALSVADGEQGGSGSQELKEEPATPSPAAAPAPVGAPTGAEKSAASPHVVAEVKSVEPDKATEDEITALGLKEKAAGRFRELSGEVKALAPVKEVIEKSGIKDISELPKIMQDASSGREIFQQIQESGVTPEQYGMLLDAGSLINQAMRGDVKSAERAIDMLTGELVALSKLTGREIPGVHDPLAEHADLVDQVGRGEMPREAALQVARARQTSAMAESGAHARNLQQQSQEVRARAMQDLNALGAELAGIDPHYAAKAPVLMAQLQSVIDSVDPSRLPGIARRLYASIPNPVAIAPPAAAPAPAPAKPTPGPVRGVSIRPDVAPVSDDPFVGLERGIAEANGEAWTG